MGPYQYSDLQRRRNSELSIQGLEWKKALLSLTKEHLFSSALCSGLPMVYLKPPRLIISKLRYQVHSRCPSSL